MLTITRTAPDAFTARAGGEPLGSCRFRADGDATEIAEIALADETDTALLDGLVRTALFCGLEEGRALGRVAPEAFARHAGALEALGLGALRADTPIEKLPRKCAH